MGEEKESEEWKFFDWSLPDKESKTAKQKVQKVIQILDSVKAKWRGLVNEMALLEGHIVGLKEMINRELEDK